MALMGCLGCAETYEIGLTRCPHCGTRSPLAVEEEGEMPKITSGGASNAGDASEAAGIEGVAAEAVAEVDAAPGPADAEVTGAEPVTTIQWVGEAGPELTNLPPGNTLTADQVAASSVSGPAVEEPAGLAASESIEPAAETDTVPAEEAAEPNGLEQPL